jgi:hypothetical protein
MPTITTVTTDVQINAQYRAVDEAGDAVAITPSRGALNQLTPLSAMELYEQLHAGRNQVRREIGLPELASPDEAVLVLAFLRKLREEPAENLGEMIARFDAVAILMQMNRADAAEISEEEHARIIDLAQRIPHQKLNGQEPAEVT